MTIHYPSQRRRAERFLTSLSRLVTTDEGKAGHPLVRLKRSPGRRHEGWAGSGRRRERLSELPRRGLPDPSPGLDPSGYPRLILSNSPTAPGLGESAACSPRRASAGLQSSSLGAGVLAPRGDRGGVVRCVDLRLLLAPPAGATPAGTPHRSSSERGKEQFTEKEEKEKDNSTLAKTPLELPEKNKQILVLGLDGAGKTSVLHSLALNRVQHSVAPTQGFNAVCISTEDSQLEFLEIGGSKPFRSCWEMYLSKGLLLIFVVDSADHNRLPEAKKHLHQLIGTNPILPLVVFANKQDLEAAYHITDIHEALALSEVGNDRKMFLFGTQVTENGSEIPSIMQDARDLIAQLAADMQ
ncbi:ADP-ribosylation factor-like protein 9 [Neophocaena asiaeorientalis asiaeorientalis]|uniref:ADP-ribosylation factor-like protein 9 n=2 Tax=Cetacea TaxID=9721 RepID=A0A341BI74_NEOAA|nr:ADP-ribosylation factor-like protein 9 [Neophocaena asiaeorientalis asiaeorientalis]